MFWKFIKIWLSRDRPSEMAEITEEENNSDQDNMEVNDKFVLHNNRTIASRRNFS